MGVVDVDGTCCGHAASSQKQGSKTHMCAVLCRDLGRAYSHSVSLSRTSEFSEEVPMCCLRRSICFFSSTSDRLRHCLLGEENRAERSSLPCCDDGDGSRTHVFRLHSPGVVAHGSPASRACCTSSYRLWCCHQRLMRNAIKATMTEQQSSASCEGGANPLAAPAAALWSRTAWACSSTMLQTAGPASRVAARDVFVYSEVAA